MCNERTVVAGHAREVVGGRGEAGGRVEDSGTH